MKSHLSKMTTVAVLGSLAAASAQAQTNVTVYGSLDAGVAYINNLGGASATRLDQGTMQPDRIGFRGTEDLGGGMKALFQLEAGFATDTGNQVNAGRLFNRNSTVGLQGSMGTVTLGNMPDIVFDYAGKLSNGFQLTNFYLFHPGNLDTLANTYQFNNAVRYTSPTVGGLTASAMVGLGEQPGDASRNRNLSAGATYVTGPLRVVAAYSRQNDRAAGYAGAFLSTLGRGTAATVFDSLTTWAGGAGYTVGNWRLNALYTQSRVALPAAAGFTQKNEDLGAAWHYGTNTTLNFGYSHTSLEGARYNQVSVSHVLALSKRTEFYVQAAYQKAGGSAKVAFQNYTGASSDGKQLVTTIGLHHLF